jgi:hypothetical protein
MFSKVSSSRELLLREGANDGEAKPSSAAACNGTCTNESLEVTTGKLAKSNIIHQNQLHNKCLSLRPVTVCSTSVDGIHQAHETYLQSEHQTGRGK